MKFVKLLILSFFALGMIINSAFAGGKLVIASNASDAAPKKAFEDIVAKFQAANPDIEVVLNTTEHEAFKTAIRTILAADKGPDVATWFAGNRMAGFVADGLFADISDVWASEGWDSSMASTMPSVTFNGKQYAVPYSYYQWGIYYRKDIYEANGISIPKTYDEFLDNCKKLKAKGIASVAIGTKYLWTAAGWFDYINMRTNGLDYHINLMLGKTKYTDQGVVNTFKNWARAIDAGCFMDDHQNYSWQEAQPPLINGEAASYLIGNFIVNNLPEETQAQLDFYQFPPIDPSLELGEDAPTEIIFMPANAQNVENGKKFMAFFAQPENLTAMNNVLGQLSTHSGSAAPSDRFQRAGAEMLSKSKTAQFFDRDTTPEMAKAAMQLMVDFMLEPENMMEILEEIEEERSRIFGG
jgi:multiple sugar transport system substrate-binding protein|tara:strand:- start:913 stop:2145 length:1233 start_codon:yes stop_codon:yes gene_type:complete